MKQISGLEISENKKSKRIINITIKEEALDKLVFPLKSLISQLSNTSHLPDLRLQKV